MTYIQHINRGSVYVDQSTIQCIQSMDIECQYRYMKEGKGSFSCVAALLEKALVNTTAHDPSQRGKGWCNLWYQHWLHPSIMKAQQGKSSLNGMATMYVQVLLRV